MFAIGEASRQSGVGIETIRYYEREGIVPTAERTASGRRVYNREAIGCLRFIKRCRDHGFSIADSRALLALAKNSDTACSTAMKLGAQHLSDVRRKIAELQKLEAALEELAANCANGRLDCPMLDVLTRD
jgi:MerR family transcriptional regulator, mercuric resistance operon regulatory protein